MEETSSPKDLASPPREWNPQEFAFEQIRGLVRQVFLRGTAGAAKHVVFSAVSPETDTSSICDEVGRALAHETVADIAIVDRNVLPTGQAGSGQFGPAASSTIKDWATRTGVNLWHVPESELHDRVEETGTSRYWLSRLLKLRHEFEYVVIQGPAAGISSEAALLGRLSDGIILVLDAQSTRRATARKIKENLEGAQARILGTVLCERLFPVPESIYRRL